MLFSRRRGFAATLGSLTWFLGSLAAAPAAAGTLYVAVPPSAGAGEVEVVAFNPDPITGRRYVVRWLAAGTDGTLGRDGATPQTVQVGRLATGVLKAPATAGGGLLEIASAPQLFFQAHLRTAGSAAGPSLPVIDSESVVDAGAFAVLSGLERAGAGTSVRTADVGVANLGHGAALCTARLTTAAGLEPGERVTFSLPPLSYAYFEDALAAYGVHATSHATLRVACDQPFHAHAIQGTGAGGPARVVLPAASGRSTLVLPGELPGTHPPGSVVFARTGAFHTAHPTKPTAVFEIDVPAGKSFRRVEVGFDYAHAGWSHTPHGNHSLFWLHRGRWLQSRWADNIYAFVNAFGGSKGLVKVLTNVDAGKARQVWSTAYQMVAGRTYRVSYVFDTDSRVLRLRLADKASGATVVDLAGDTYGKPIVADAQGAFFVYFGHQDDTGIAPERPSYGSTWSDLEVVFVP